MGRSHGFASTASRLPAGRGCTLAEHPAGGTGEGGGGGAATRLLGRSGCSSQGGPTATHGWRNPTVAPPDPGAGCGRVSMPALLGLVACGVVVQASRWRRQGAGAGVGVTLLYCLRNESRLPRGGRGGGSRAGRWGRGATAALGAGVGGCLEPHGAFWAQGAAVMHAVPAPFLPGRLQELWAAWGGQLAGAGPQSAVARRQLPRPWNTAPRPRLAPVHREAGPEGRRRGSRPLGEARGKGLRPTADGVQSRFPLLLLYKPHPLLLLHCTQYTPTNNNKAHTRPWALHPTYTKASTSPPPDPGGCAQDEGGARQVSRTAPPLHGWEPGSSMLCCMHKSLLTCWGSAGRRPGRRVTSGG